MVGVANKTRKMVDWSDLLQTDLPPMTVTYLETLNREQRRAVEQYQPALAAAEKMQRIIARAIAALT